MAEKNHPVLFFIISPKYNLSAVENFLKKRNYTVHSETDIKVGLKRLIDVNPDFIFIALDHPNSKVAMLPKIIEQCLETNIIPFTHAGDKQSLQKLDECTLIHKIYPPLSGPAIERMALNILSSGLQVEKRIKSNQQNEAIVSGFLNQLSDKINDQIETPEPKQHVNRLKIQNSFFAKSTKSPISSSQRLNLQTEFKKKFQAELADVMETCVPHAHSNVIPLHDEQKTLHCLLVQSEAWSGHLMAYSNVKLESHLLEPVFKNWVSQEFQYFNDHESHLFFDIEINLGEFKKWIAARSEHFETLKVNDSELMISFVGIEPAQLLLDFNEETDLIGVSLDMIPLNEELKLSLFLHLPENKKFLLYTPAHQAFTTNQKQRLIANRVDLLHTPVEFEGEVKKLKMKKHLHRTFEDFRNENE